MAKSNRYARTQKSSNKLICFHCSNSCFLSETGIAGHERLLLAKWHPKSEKKLRKQPFFDSADRHEKLYGRSWLYTSAQGRHETGGVLSLFSSLSFDISIKNSMQRWSSDFQGLFCVKIRKMAQGSNDLSTLPLTKLWSLLIRGSQRSCIYSRWCEAHQKYRVFVLSSLCLSIGLRSFCSTPNLHHTQVEQQGDASNMLNHDEDSMTSIYLRL